MFGSKKREQERNIREVAEAYQVGYNGGVEEFKATNQAYLENRDRDGEIRSNPARAELASSAIQRYAETGSAENVQEMMREPMFYLIGSWYDNDNTRRLTVISDVVKRRPQDEPATTIKTLLGGIPEEQLQPVLDTLLASAMQDTALAPLLIDPLLEVGANAGAAISGKSAYALRCAVSDNQPLEIIEKLVKSGADIDTALFDMKVKGENEKSIHKMQAFRDKILGTAPAAAPAAAQPAPANDDTTHETLLMLVEMVKELTEKVDRLEAAQPKPAAAPAEEPAAAPAPAPQISYRKVMGGP